MIRLKWTKGSRRTRLGLRLDRDRRPRLLTLTREILPTVLVCRGGIVERLSRNRILILVARGRPRGGRGRREDRRGMLDGTALSDGDDSLGREHRGEHAAVRNEGVSISELFPEVLVASARRVLPGRDTRSDAGLFGRVSEATQQTAVVLYFPPTERGQKADFQLTPLHPSWASSFASSFASSPRGYP